MERTCVIRFSNENFPFGAEYAIIRTEKEKEYREVENLVRESFWNVHRPGCLEHYVLHQLRKDADLFYTEIVKQAACLAACFASVT